MKAAVRESYGGSEVIEVKDISKPEPGPGEALVKVMYTTVNRTDCGILTGLPRIFRLFIGLGKPRNPVLGSDFAGVVVSTGSEEKLLRKGDRVCGFGDEGIFSQAEYVLISKRMSAERIPDGVTDREMVASLEGAHYALNFINKVKLSPGDKVMVYGASGAIGSAMVQILKYRGLYVTAVTEGRHLEAVSGLGADRVIDLDKESFINPGEYYSCIFDAVGKCRFRICKPALEPGGIYISSELGPGSENIYLSLLGIFHRGKRVKFPFPHNTSASLRYMIKLLSEGKYKPLIDREYSLEEVASAYEYVLSGKKQGNVLLRLS